MRRSLRAARASCGITHPRSELIPDLRVSFKTVALRCSKVRAPAAFSFRQREAAPGGCLILRPLGVKAVHVEANGRPNARHRTIAERFSGRYCEPPEAWALLPRVGESANANLSGVITGRVSVLAGPAVTCGPG